MNFNVFELRLSYVFLCLCSTAEFCVLMFCVTAELWIKFPLKIQNVAKRSVAII